MSNIKNCIEIVTKKEDGSIYIVAKKIQYNSCDYKDGYKDGYGPQQQILTDIVCLESTQYFFKNLTEEELASKILEIESE